MSESRIKLSHIFPRTGTLEPADGSDHRIYFEDYGPKDNTAHFMIHGNAGYLLDPARLEIPADKDRRIVILHMRGVGNSLPSGDIRHNLYPDLAEDIETLRASLGLEKIYLTGWSGGAAVCLLYAEKYPDRCLSLTLVNAFLGTRQELEHYYSNLPGRYPAGTRDFCQLYGTDDLMQAVRMCNQDILSGDHDRARRAALAYEGIFGPVNLSPVDTDRLVQNRIIFANMSEKNFGLAEDQIEKNLERLPSVPVVFVNGADDHVVSPEKAKSLARKIPGARCIIVAGAGHDIHEPSIQACMNRGFELRQA